MLCSQVSYLIDGVQDIVCSAKRVTSSMRRCTGQGQQFCLHELMLNELTPLTSNFAWLPNGVCQSANEKVSPAGGSRRGSQNARNA